LVWRSIISRWNTRLRWFRWWKGPDLLLQPTSLTRRQEKQYWRQSEQYHRRLKSSDARFSGSNFQESISLVTYYVPRLLPVYRSRSQIDIDILPYRLPAKIFCKWHRMVYGASTVSFMPSWLSFCFSWFHRSTRQWAKHKGLWQTSVIAISKKCTVFPVYYQTRRCSGGPLNTHRSLKTCGESGWIQRDPTLPSFSKNPCQSVERPSSHIVHLWDDLPIGIDMAFCLFPLNPMRHRQTLSTVKERGSVRSPEISYAYLPVRNRLPTDKTLETYKPRWTREQELIG
jgi:hypothetical protein